MGGGAPPKKSLELPEDIKPSSGGQPAPAPRRDLNQSLADFKNERLERYWGGHMDFAALKVAAEKAAETGARQLLIPMPFTSPNGGKKGPEAPSDGSWARVLEQLVRILTGYSPLRFMPFRLLQKHGETAENTERRWRTIMGLEEIQYLPEDVDDPDRRVSLGLTAHEIWHVLFSRPELIFDEPQLIENMAFQALWWAVEDPRVNVAGLLRHPGAQEWLAVAVGRNFQIKDLNAERKRWAEEVPLHLQYNYALIYEWAADRFGWSPRRDPRLSDPRVREALDKTAEALRRAIRAKSAKLAFDIVKDEIWPVYKDLVDQAYEEEQKKQNGRGQGQGQESDSDSDSDSDADSDSSSASSKSRPGKPGKSKSRPSESVKAAMEKKEKDFRDKHASKIVDKPEQMSRSQRDAAKRELEKMRKRMGEKWEGDARDAQQGEGESDDDATRQMSAEEKVRQRERLNRADERREVDGSDQAVYKDYYDRVKRLIPITRQQLLQELKRKVRRRLIRDRRAGDLDEDALAEIPGGRRDVFHEEYIANRSLYRVSLLIDTSGSMGREKKERAIEGAIMLMEALDKVPGVALEIAVYDSTPRVVKPYGEKLSPSVKAAVVKSILQGSGSTESHVAVQGAIQRARLGRGEKLIFVVNDGDPDYNFDRDRYRAMLRAAKDVEVHGIGLGAGAELVTELFPLGRGWWLKDPAELARKIREILRKKILGRA